MVVSINTTALEKTVCAALRPGPHIEFASSQGERPRATTRGAL